ncbi:MAG: molybdopterin biosynthesis protein [Clostridia bacterium]|nr:molybdopterin biosynthesis protein [Clostridia bacterium]
MKHDYLLNTPLSEAKSIFFEAVKNAGFSAKSELIDSKDASGRITAEAVYAKISSPHYNASAMDGIAVSAKSTFGASENTPAVLSKDEYTVVDTGDPLPEGTDAVIMIEDVREDGEGNVRLLSAVSPWQNVRQVGEDLCMGDMIAPCSTPVTPALAGAFLAGGVTRVRVKKRPVFGIVPTGDEIVEPTSDPAEGEIIEFNSTIFSSMLRESGALVKVHPIVKDDRNLIKAAVSELLESCDAVLVLAGSSAGRDDYTSLVCEELGSVLVHGIAVKPGKPAVLGLARSKPFIGLPGYPVSAMVIMEEIVKPLCALYYSLPERSAPKVRAVLSRRVVSSLKYEEFVRVSLGTVGNVCYAVPLPRGAGVITSVTKAGGILRLPQDLEGFEAGCEVEVEPLVPPERIKNTLVVTGSHDPLIDEIANEVNARDLGFTVVSSHVGSMGALKAVAAGQAHMGACHLLDETNGTYNASYVQKYFPEGGAVLKKGVGRIQGLMTAPGNPLGITGVNDLKRVRYVNRQRGAGTRVLLDYLIRENGVSSDKINGYGNEKFTHTAVAAFIAAGNADAGMGILSAARIYGLDFVPLYNEEYDFLIAEEFENDPKVKAFFEILESASFKRKLAEMGGYITEGI